MSKCFERATCSSGRQNWFSFFFLLSAPHFAVFHSHLPSVSLMLRKWKRKKWKFARTQNKRKKMRLILIMANDEELVQNIAREKGILTISMLQQESLFCSWPVSCSSIEFNFHPVSFTSLIYLIPSKTLIFFRHFIQSNDVFAFIFAVSYANSKMFGLWIVEKRTNERMSPASLFQQTSQTSQHSLNVNTFKVLK